MLAFMVVDKTVGVKLIFVGVHFRFCAKFFFQLVLIVCKTFP
jgi:hypothetical protein